VSLFRLDVRIAEQMQIIIKTNVVAIRWWPRDFNIHRFRLQHRGSAFVCTES
jgi:hypothetical protein